MLALKNPPSLRALARAQHTGEERERERASESARARETERPPLPRGPFGSGALVRVRRAHDHDLPLEDVALVHQPC